MTPRSLCVALWICAIAAPTSQAGPTFTFNAGPAPGPGGFVGDVNYQGPNQFGGSIGATTPYGILGTGTSLNSGTYFPDFNASFSVLNGSGSFDISGSNGVDFTGQVSSSNVGGTGGTFVVSGTFDAAASAFFGLPQATELTGTVTLQLAADATSGQNRRGALQFSFAPGFATPEPASVLMVGLGLAGVAASRRGRAPGALTRPSGP